MFLISDERITPVWVVNVSGIFKPFDIPLYKEYDILEEAENYCNRLNLELVDGATYQYYIYQTIKSESKG